MQRLDLMRNGNRDEFKNRIRHRFIQPAGVVISSSIGIK